MSVNRPTETLAQTLAPILDRHWLLVGVGNDMRGDDAFGPLLARALRDLGLPALDGGMAPENLTGPILRAAPDELILADIADFGAEPGDLRLLAPDELMEGSASTHDTGFGALLAYLTSQKPMNMCVLAMQPASLGLGDPPGPHVTRALEEALRIFRTNEDVERARCREAAHGQHP